MERIFASPHFGSALCNGSFPFLQKSLKCALRNRVQHIVAALSSRDIRSPELEIALEKVTRLVHSSQSWLFEAIPNLSRPTQICSSQESPVPSNIQPIQEGGRYVNHRGEKIWRQFLQTLYLLFPGACSRSSNEDLSSWHRQKWMPRARSIAPCLTWLGHATMLIQIAGINILTDPSFGFVAPCFLRHTAPPIPIENLPPLDIIFLSHNHGDHADWEFLKKTAPYQPIVFAPDGFDPWFKKHGYEHAEGKKWWQRSTIVREGQRITLTAIPAQHGSQSTLTDLNRALWMGLLIELENGPKIYFAGDTGYNQALFREIEERIGSIDIACLPIAPDNEPEMHLNYHQALTAFEDLNAAYCLPIHHGVYRTGKEKIEDPLNLFLEEAERRGLSDKILNLKLGETHVATTADQHMQAV